MDQVKRCDGLQFVKEHSDAKIMQKKKTQVKIVPFKLDELEKIQRREKSFHKVRYPMMQIMNFKATTHGTCRVDVA